MSSRTDDAGLTLYRLDEVIGHLERLVQLLERRERHECGKEPKWYLEVQAEQIERKRYE